MISLLQNCPPRRLSACESRFVASKRTLVAANVLFAAANFGSCTFQIVGPTTSDTYTLISFFLGGLEVSEVASGTPSLCKRNGFHTVCPRMRMVKGDPKRSSTTGFIDTNRI